MSETQGFPAKPHTQESMTSPAPAPRHFCGFSQTVAHKNFIVGMKKLLQDAGAEREKWKNSSEVWLQDTLHQIYLTHFTRLLYSSSMREQTAEKCLLRVNFRAHGYFCVRNREIHCSPSSEEATVHFHFLMENCSIFWYCTGKKDHYINWPQSSLNSPLQ